MNGREYFYCPNCDCESLLCYPEVLPRVKDSELPGEIKTFWLVAEQTCGCSKITKIIKTEDEEGVQEDYEYFLKSYKPVIESTRFVRG